MKGQYTIKPELDDGCQSEYKRTKGNLMENEYLAKFDASGHRETTVVSGVNYITDDERQGYLEGGYIVISDEDDQPYVGNCTV